MDLHIAVTEADFDVGAEYQAATTAAADAGGVVLFTGCVRAGTDVGRLVALELEHYPGVTETSIRQLAAVAGERWPLQALRIIHRVGRLAPGAQIVLVIAASRHRQAAFDAARFVMDYLKTEAVFWKREVFAEGARWVEARSDDHAATAAWRG